MLRSELLALHSELCDRARALMTAKNHDYTGASGDPFSNFRASEALGVQPVISILIRMLDKMQRVKTFTEKGELRVANESVQDAILDIINYAVLIAGMIVDASSMDADV